MNIYPTFTNLRSNVSYRFSALRERALRAMLWAKLTRKKSSLGTFPEEVQRNNPNKKLLGVKEIRVDQIVGTLNRSSDFDHEFRPLKQHLLHRWVDTFIGLHHDEWSPIVVHKIGEQYYVEAGHHRVSVARSVGMFFIEARIWEYRSEPELTDICEVIQCVEPSSSKVYAVG